jgi:phytoene dehydrogenase-like protein
VIRNNRTISNVIVIGAGIGGLTTAARLARAGLNVTVLEAHIYPGGCAGTFYHQGYRFDAGATLASGFYAGGPMDRVARSVGIDHWPARAGNPAMMVHLPDGTGITRWADERRWVERRAAFGAKAEAFWRWQERTADALWSLAVVSALTGQDRYYEGFYTFEADVAYQILGMAQVRLTLCQL